MNKWFKLGAVAVLSCGIIGTSTLVLAAPKKNEKDEAIEYRRAVFEVIKWNFSLMKAMAKGETPFNAEDFAKYAARVEAVSSMPLEGFIPDSGIGSTQAKTEAKPQIWKNWDDFKTKMTQFEEAAAQLATVAKTGQEEAMKSQFLKTGEACKSCHDDYRED